jgi:predicted RND superfamily exporter protein
MFQILARIILKNRRLLLVVFTLLTAFFGFMASRIQLSYDFAKILPSDNTYSVEYEKFKSTFGEDGTVMVLGIDDPEFYSVDKFNGWYKLGKAIKSIDGIEAVVSVAEIYSIEANREDRKFEVKPLLTEEVRSQEELDNFRKEVESLPFYKGFITSEDGKASLMAITFDKNKVNTRSRIGMVDEIVHLVETFESETGMEVHVSGMPFIRTAITSKISGEMKIFMLLGFLVCGLILMIFFRSFNEVFFSLIVVLVGVIWSVGTIALFGYKITILTALIPPLIIVIGIPNSILLLNKYHHEFQIHGNKIKALARVIQRIGLTTLLANLTTAIGFGVFCFTNSQILAEFGLVASINVMSTFLISLVLIPVVFSFLPSPSVSRMKHLKAPRLNMVLRFIDKIIVSHYRAIFAVVVFIVIISVYGITKIRAVGFVVDDLPKDDPVYVDMRFFESNFKGVLPLEIAIDAQHPGKALDPANLHKINRLERMLSTYPEFSKPLAVVDGIKFAYQSYRGGDAKYYVLPGTLDLAEMSSYLRNDDKNKSTSFKSFLDSTRQITRVSVQMADVGSVRMEELINELQPRVDSIFPASEFKVSMTGNSLIFLRGNDYLLRNLIESIILAFVLISLTRLLLFTGIRMIVISIIPSLVPLIMTAGIMGYLGIALKPSTILIFSIAFGIATDGAIYFLTKYRQELKLNPMSISKAVSITIRETGVSMIYTAVILFFGFLIFAASSFGGTAALGILISITLLVAMCSNMILLPAFLIALERRVATKSFLKDPLVQIVDEDEDIELGELRIRKVDDILGLEEEEADAEVDAETQVQISESKSPPDKLV